MRILVLAFVLHVLQVGISHAQTVIVDENFDSYANDDEFLAVWQPTVGNGNTVLDPAEIDYLSAILTNDSATYPGLQGQAADHIGATSSNPGMVNQYLPPVIGDGPEPGFEATPSATQNLVLEADIFDNGIGNKRMTVGLRNRTNVTNILELGLYNSNSCDPTVDGCANAGELPQNATDQTPGFYPGSGYAYRMILFPIPEGSELLGQPDWQYFQLPQQLDVATAPAAADYNEDGTTNAADYVAFRNNFGQTVALPNENPDATTPGEVDEEDYSYWAENFGATGGGDGVVGIFDVSVYAAANELDPWHTYRAIIGEETITVELDLFRDGINNGTNEPGVDASQTYTIATSAPGFDSLRIGGPSGLASGGDGGSELDDGVVYDNISLTLVDLPPEASTASSIPEPASTLLAALGLACWAIVINRRKFRQ